MELIVIMGYIKTDIYDTPSPYKYGVIAVIEANVFDEYCRKFYDANKHKLIPKFNNEDEFLYNITIPSFENSKIQDSIEYNNIRWSSEIVKKQANELTSEQINLILNKYDSHCNNNYYGSMIEFDYYQFNLINNDNINSLNINEVEENYQELKNKYYTKYNWK